MTVKCRICGTEIPDDQKLCPECGRIKVNYPSALPDELKDLLEEEKRWYEQQTDEQNGIASTARKNEADLKKTCENQAKEIETLQQEKTALQNDKKRLEKDRNDLEKQKLMLTKERNDAQSKLNEFYSLLRKAKHCPKCDFPIMAGEKYCGDCGLYLQK